MVKQEFRLYYDDVGRVLFYTCEKPEGKYVVIDSFTFAQGRPDVRVVDGRVTANAIGSVVSRLFINSDGTNCASEDISVIVPELYLGPTTKWKLKTYEL